MIVNVVFHDLTLNMSFDFPEKSKKQTMKTGDGNSSRISYGFGDFSRSGERFNNAYLNVRFKNNDRQSV